MIFIINLNDKQYHFDLNGHSRAKQEILQVIKRERNYPALESAPDLLNSLTSESNKQIDNVFEKINSNNKGVIVFINQTANPDNVLFRLNELKSIQSTGKVKSPPLLMDKKDFGIGAQILHDLKVHKIQLLTNSTQIKRVGMIGYGLEIVEYVKY